MAALSLLKNKLEAFICSANTALKLKLVRKEEDTFNDETTFSPEFTHQVFGDNETIFGYNDLSLQLYYTAGSLHTYLGLKYENKIDPASFEGVEADVILPKIADKIQPGFETSLDEFVKKISLNNSKFRPHGDKLHQFTITDSDNRTNTYEIYKTDITIPGFKDYHERLQTFVLWYIDAASFIDDDDEKWKFYLVYEIYKENAETRYGIVGFCTVYHYYAYPNYIRPRISQTLVLPPWQKKGIGAELLQTIYTHYIPDSNVLDITVEDPSYEFTRLRDFVDTKNCMKLKSFQPEKLVKGFRDEMATEAQTKLKINKKQSRRVYEILRYKITDFKNEDEHRAYRLDIKKRLNLPFQKQLLELSKLQKTLRPEELNAALNCTNKEQRMEMLERMYNDLRTEYRKIVDRVVESNHNM